MKFIFFNYSTRARCLRATFCCFPLKFNESQSDCDSCPALLLSNRHVLNQSLNKLFSSPPTSPPSTSVLFLSLSLSLSSLLHAHCYRRFYVRMCCDFFLCTVTLNDLRTLLLLRILLPPHCCCCCKLTERNLFLFLLFSFVLLCVSFVYPVATVASVLTTDDCWIAVCV